MAQGSSPWAREGLAAPQAVCWHSAFNYPHCWSLRGDESACAAQISPGKPGLPGPVPVGTEEPVPAVLFIVRENIRAPLMWARNATL